ncbi:O-antigen ligase [Clostridium cavendishii DSM 21758]|uniref:O-antigen ligase n=1 Tax=Clostridium cavendishii DSM 21758 TaxID=1121302 RepID=A0A1M6Q5S8_9CLOT|nr:O-antigen ligase family protein [Clostridium cavendishii]SHK15498.1 O-antigen ligase [Clostridium cavendishii DSM 21758]
MLRKINRVFFALYIISLMYIPEFMMSLMFKEKQPPISEVILVCAWLFFGLQFLISREKRKYLINLFKNKLFLVLNLLFISIIILMIISKRYAPEQKLWLQETIRFISVYFLIIYCSLEYTTEKISKIIIKGIFFSCVFVTLLGFYQFATGKCIPPQFVGSHTFGVMVRVTSIFSNPNSYAAFIVILIFPIFMVTMYEKNNRKKILYSIILLLLIVNLFMTFSRSSWLGLVLGLVVLSILWNKKLIYAIGALAVLTVSITPMRNRFLELFSKSFNDDRIKIWKTYIHMIKDNFWFGVGNGNGVSKYDYYIAKYPELNYNSYTRYPSHNSYLKIFSELGVFGLVLFVLLIIIMLIIINKYYRTTQNYFMKSVYLGIFASIISICFMNLNDNLFFVPKMISILWILIGIGIGNYFGDKQGSLNKS